MSVFMAGTVAGASILVGLLVVMAEQLRVALSRRREVERDVPCVANVIRSNEARRGNAVPSTATALPNSRAVAYREILEALGDDLDDDIAEWEAVLQDFPQVIGAEELLAADERSHEPMVETAYETTAAESLPKHETITPPHRTRRVSPDERGMIQRLMRTGFAPEEIALWLNLPLERVQEFLPRD